MSRTTRRLISAGVLATLATASHSALARDVLSDVGLTSLIARLGAGNQPTGAGIVVGQVEAAEEGSGGYYPNPSNPDFAGKIFTAGSGPLGLSGHATVVGQNFYGVNSIAPGITSIITYGAGNWAQQGFLHAADGTGFQPNPSPANLRVFNHSWIGAFGPGNEWADNEMLRRADLVVDRDDVLIVNGVNNLGVPDPTQRPLMAFNYNGISVGLASGGHTSGNTFAPWDGPGRQKPEIVAPNSFTSFSTPIVSAGAALMYQVAQTASGLASNPNARKSETIKAVILAGGNHGFNGAHPWSNNPVASGPSRGITATPLDPVYGVDVLNVDNSHRILTGLEQNGLRSVPATVNAQAAGWDLGSFNQGNVLNYRFRVHQQVATVSILATWHRRIDTAFANPQLANIDLTLKRIDATGAAVSLVGPAGTAYFSSGNVVSQSAVDNVEHLFVRDLAAGDYVIEVRRLNDGVNETRDVALAWIMPATFRPGDINRDGTVNTDDLLALLGGWGVCPNPSNCPADITGNGAVDTDDLLLLLGNWGA